MSILGELLLSFLISSRSFDVSTYLDSGVFLEEFSPPSH